MAFDSVSAGRKLGIGFTVSALAVLVLLVASYLLLGRVGAASGVSSDLVSLVSSGQTTLLGIGIVGFLVVCGVGFWSVKGALSGFTRAINSLVDCRQELNMSVDQLTSSSQSLADGTTGQAANLEETSSAIEELSSLTRNNADNTKEADMIMTSAQEAFSEADNSIQKLTTSMGEITVASEQTQKIVKTIDEIAFQTNLLALNAAVEAARAGEAGAGFAVVADEVRNLAMRAAEAAKDTSVMIDATVNKVQVGTSLVTETNELFYMASKASEKVGVLITEIATASEEQASGISQIGHTINDMDRLTQGLAATSEESASASMTLKGQITELDRVSSVLMGLIGQQQGSNVSAPRRTASTKPSPVVKRVPKAATPAPPVKQLPPTPTGSSKKSEDVIPFDDDDFEDF